MSKQFVYPGIAHGPEGLVVERLGREEGDAVVDLLPAIVGLTRRAYSRVLETPDGPLEHGLMNREYTEAAKTDAQLNRLKRVLGAGGAYYVVRSPEDPNQLQGLANIKPMQVTDPWYDYFTEHVYIHDILADPPGSGIGSAVLHAMLKDQDLYTWETAHLDAFYGSRVNNWYERLGFEEQGPSGGWEIAGTAVPTTRFAANPIYSVIQKLEAAHPALKDMTTLR